MRRRPVALLASLVLALSAVALGAPSPAQGLSAPTISSVSPRSGSITGGTRVTILGSRFRHVKWVHFGTTAATSIRVVSRRKLLVTSPAHAAGGVHVRVRSASGTSRARTADRFTYGVPPTVTDLLPSSGSTDGGTRVTITGTHLSGARSVTFGGVPGTGLKVHSPTSLTVLSPAHDAGAVAVRVVTRFGSSRPGTPGRFAFTALVWGTPTLIQPDPDDLAVLVDVSCASSDFCVAITKNDRAITYNGTAWSTPVVIDDATDTYGPAELTGVSCPSVSFCVVVDTLGNAVTYNGTGWADPVNVDDSSTFPWLTAVSCASSSFCAALDYDGYAMVFNGTDWTAPVYVESNFPFNHPTSVSCPSSSFCVAVDDSNQEVHARAMIFNGVTWSDPAPVAAATNYLSRVSCASKSFCAAYGGGHILFTTNATTWSPSTWNASLGGLSCTAASFCGAVAGTTSRIYDGSAWSSPVTIDSHDWLSGLSCVSSAFCAAIDQHGYAVTTQ